MSTPIPKGVLDYIRALKTVQPDELSGGAARDRLTYINGCVGMLLDRHLREPSATWIESQQLRALAVRHLKLQYHNFPQGVTWFAAVLGNAPNWATGYNGQDDFYWVTPLAANGDGFAPPFMTLKWSYADARALVREEESPSELPGALSGLLDGSTKVPGLTKGGTE